MDNRELQNRNEESAPEDEQELRFEFGCPLEEVAQLASDVRMGETARRKRDRLNPEQAAKRLQMYLSKPNAIELVLRKGEELIGCAFSYEQFAEELEKEIPVPGVNLFSREGERVFALRELDVKFSQRGYGFGQLIMERIMQEAQQKGATKLLISVFPDKDNIGFQMYKKLGFEAVAPKQNTNYYYMSYDCPLKK